MEYCLLTTIYLAAGGVTLVCLRAQKNLKSVSMSRLGAEPTRVPCTTGNDTVRWECVSIEHRGIVT